MKYVTALGSLLLFTAACGPDSELVASGKAHTCNLKKATPAL